MTSPAEELALRGGPPTFPEGPPRWPRTDARIQQALLAAWQDGSWGTYHGPHLPRLVDRLTEQFGVAHALPCSSGTFAVELALRGLGIGPGDEVILAGYDFGGNFRSVEAVGARPVLADIQADGWSLDPASVEQAAGPAVRAIIVSHLHGALAPLAELTELAHRHQWKVVEDICQTPGASVDGRRAGQWGDVAVMSFGGSKLLTAGRGGAILTPAAEVHQRAKIYCERGNHAFPLAELQAAVLLPQLETLAAENEQRSANVARLLAGLAPAKGLRANALPTGADQAAYFKLGWRYQPSEVGNQSRAAFLAAAQAEGIAIDAGFRGFVRRPASRCRQAGPLEHAQQAVEQTVVLHHPVLLESAATIDRLATGLTKVLSQLAHLPAARRP